MRFLQSWWNFFNHLRLHYKSNPNPNPSVTLSLNFNSQSIISRIRQRCTFKSCWERSNTQRVSVPTNMQLPTIADTCQRYELIRSRNIRIANYVVNSISFQAFFVHAYKMCRRHLKIHYVIAIHLMRWLTNFHDFSFK